MYNNWNEQEQEAVEQVVHPEKKLPTLKRIGMHMALFIALSLALDGAGILYYNHLKNAVCKGLFGDSTSTSNQ